MAEASPRRRRRRRAALVVLGLVLVAAIVSIGLEQYRQRAVAFHAVGQPARLSDWRLFDVRDGELVPNDGVVPYELNTPLFTDYAHKLRTVWMPAGAAAKYHGQDAFDFPVGTILSKTFYYPRLPGEADGSERVVRSEDGGGLPGGRLALVDVRLIETRLLVRRADGWVAFPYVWNDAQTDATLTRGGALVPLELVDGGIVAEPATYAVPDENQCAGCHASDLKSHDLHPLGPTARNLNREVLAIGDGGATIVDQLAEWQRSGRLVSAPDADAMPRLVSWRDPDASLDARARAYLDVNCGHCHSPRGPGNTSGLWLRSDVNDPLRLGRCKLPIAAGQGTGDHRYGYVPGQPDASILTYRMASNDPGVMMPELGRSVVHREGVELIRAWIEAQDGECGVEP